MLKLLRRHLPILRGNKGTAGLELGLIAPIFFLAMFGSIDFGRMLWVASTLENAASQGARYAMVRGASAPLPASVTDVQNYVKNRAAGVKSSDIIVNVVWSPNKNSGSTVTIDVTYQFKFFMTGFLPVGTVQLEGHSAAVIT